MRLKAIIDDRQGDSDWWFQERLALIKTSDVRLELARTVLVMRFN